jgi:hypothetical protein
MMRSCMTALGDLPVLVLAPIDEEAPAEPR